MAYLKAHESIRRVRSERSKKWVEINRLKPTSWPGLQNLSVNCAGLHDSFSIGWQKLPMR